MSRTDRVRSRNTSYAIAAGCCAMLTVFNLLDGDYWSAFSFSCIAAGLGLTLVGVEERGGFLRALPWVFLVTALLSGLARYVL